MRSNSQTAVLILIVFSTLITGCTIDTLGLGEAIMKVMTPKDGPWSGTTSQNKSITYTVSGQGAQIDPGLRVGFFCQESWGTVTGTITRNVAIPINGNQFDYNGSTFDVGGAFGSTSICSGTFHVSGSTGYPYYLTFSANGTWNANWQSGMAKASLEKLAQDSDGTYLEQNNGDTVIKMVVCLNK